MATTKIEWAERVWNPVTGCTKISPGCQNCYAEHMARRLAGRCGYPAEEPFRVTIHGDRFNEPLRFAKPQRYFVCSMGDLFHADVPDNIVYEIFAVMADTPGHTYIVLTKRPQRMKELLGRPDAANEVWNRTTYSDYPGCKKPWPLPNVWLGVTAENQQAADERIPILLQIPAAVRFVSCEPLLGPVDLYDYLQPKTKTAFYNYGGRGRAMEVVIRKEHLNWVICGGETGPNARPMHPDWVRSLRDQCNAAGVPFLFKQWGEWREACPPDDEIWNGHPPTLRHEHGTYFIRLGKKQAGRLLDGVAWDELPRF